MTPTQKSIYNFLKKKKKFLSIEEIIKQGKFKRSINFLANMYDLLETDSLEIKKLFIKGKITKCYKAK